MEIAVRTGRTALPNAESRSLKAHKTRAPTRPFSLGSARLRTVGDMMTKFLLSGILLALGSVVAAAQAKPAGSLTDVTGVWIMLVEGHQIGLELEQKDTKVLGVMLVMGQRQLLEGTYENRTLTLKAEKAPDGSAGPHGDAKAGPIEARMLDDGTLEGELSTNKGRTKWTGERLQKK